MIGQKKERCQPPSIGKIFNLMIDTIQVRIPLTARQYRAALSATCLNDGWVPCLYSPLEGRHFLRYSPGIIEGGVEKRASHDRDVRWSVPWDEAWQQTGKISKSPPYYMAVELSLPKLYYYGGHNIHLLYDWPSALELLKKIIKDEFRWRNLPPIESWLVVRCDFCYAWRLPSQELADGLIDGLKRLKYPWKEPQHRQHSAFWPGTTYSAKVYKKYQEFRANDMKKMLKAGANPDWVNHLEEMSKGVVRFEITGKRKFLQRLNITTVGDLRGKALIQHISPELHEWIKSQVNRSKKAGKLANGPETEEAVIDTLMTMMAAMGQIELSGEDGYKVTPGMTVMIPSIDIPSGLSIPEGCIKFETQPIVDYILKTYLRKLVGNGDMSMADEVLAKLQSAYPGAKGGRLMGTWTMVQKMGSKVVMEAMGRDAYYRDLRDMKAVDVFIMEQVDGLVKVGDGFFKNYKIEIPSPHVVNQYDDYRDGDNLLNLNSHRVS
jgi:hypothetical protein